MKERVAIFQTVLGTSLQVTVRQSRFGDQRQACIGGARVVRQSRTMLKNARIPSAEVDTDIKAWMRVRTTMSS